MDQNWTKSGLNYGIELNLNWTKNWTKPGLNYGIELNLNWTKTGLNLQLVWGKKK